MGIINDLKQEKNFAVVIADHNGLITYVNAHFETIFKWTLAEIQGKPINIIIPPPLHDAHNLGFSRFLSTETPTLLNKPLNLNALKKTGEEFKSIHTIFAEKLEGEWVFGAKIIPLDEAIHNASQ